jgi:hypothetical protein
MSDEELRHLEYKIEDGRFKLTVDGMLLFNIHMFPDSQNFLLPRNKVDCLYRIFSEHAELLMLFLMQLEKEGKLQQEEGKE